MAKTVTAAEVCGKLDEILDQVRERGDQYIIERDGKPVAAVVPVEQLEGWQKTREAYFARIDELRAQNKDVDPDEIERVVEEVRREVRGQQ